MPANAGAVRDRAEAASLMPADEHEDGLPRRPPARGRSGAAALRTHRVRAVGRRAPADMAAARLGALLVVARGVRRLNAVWRWERTHLVAHDREALPRGRHPAHAATRRFASGRRVLELEQRCRPAARLRHGGRRPARGPARAAAAQRVSPPRAAGRLMAAPPVEVRGLTKRYGATTAVDDLSFSNPARSDHRLPRAQRCR